MLRKASLGLIMALAACGSARLIQQTPQGGVLELQGDRGKAMEDAQNQMSAQCGPNNYTIVQQGEEAIGTDTYSRQDSSAVDQTSRSGRTTTSDQTSSGVQSTRTATAWRVHYQCNGAMPAAGQMPPPGGQMGAPPPPGGQPPAGPPPGPAPGY
ncbi:MAG: hypothetical protein JO257_27960 [Deltaproteobacteria bacterium]|nr:hypothetical protein [Deltaproteobacteria bacterium]